MKICVIVGSNRLHGISRQVCKLIKQYIKGKAEVSYIYLSEKNIELCDGDNKCSHQPCSINDDMESIVREMFKADGIIYMPVMHAYGTNSRFQAFLERAGYGYFRPLDRPLKDKVASVIVIGRRYGHTSVYSQIVLNIMLNKMILAGSGFPVLFMGMLGQASDDLEALEALEETLDRMISVSYRLNAGILIKEQVYA
ncbi:flavodoxin family protein [Vibrio sp.]|uniref:flavodoxin family protein n=1 Tax=Vibrio sp. TaxID=678 RepID=UPI00311E452E